MSVPTPSANGPTRRAAVLSTASLLGGVALYSLLGRRNPATADAAPASPPPPTAVPAKSGGKRVIYLYQSGGPSQMELFDDKPKLRELTGTDIPPSVLQDAAIPDQTKSQRKLPIIGSPYQFARAGKCGMGLSQLLPHLASVADDITLLRAVHTDQTEHMPAATLYFTGHDRAGRPSLGSWIAYGLGAEDKNLPEFVVLLSGSGGQPLHGNFWGSGFIPKRYAGVEFRSVGDPVLYIGDPKGIDRAARRRMLDCVNQLNGRHFDAVRDPEIQARVHAYEQAFRMQASVPELGELAKEPAAVLEKYGVTPGVPSYAANCLLARRLVERGVRFVQLCHRDWDHHAALPGNIEMQCRTTDRASAALIWDLKRLGLLDDTLVVWGGEFGRTPYSQGEIKDGVFGRDHHPRCFSMWMAGGGVRGGHTHGATDDFSFNGVDGKVHIHDLHATILHLLGIDHTALTYRYQGRDFRLTDIAGTVVKPILA